MDNKGNEVIYLLSRIKELIEQLKDTSCTLADYRTWYEEAVKEINKNKSESLLCGASAVRGLKDTLAKSRSNEARANNKVRELEEKINRHESHKNMNWYYTSTINEQPKTNNDMRDFMKEIIRLYAMSFSGIVVAIFASPILFASVYLLSLLIKFCLAIFLFGFK